MDVLRGYDFPMKTEQLKELQAPLKAKEYGKRAAEQRIMGPQLLPSINGAAGDGEHDAKCAEAGIAKLKF
jgi:hypothetical protein